MIDYQTSIPTRTWREKTDSPTLWVFVITSSIALHLAVLSAINLSSFGKQPQNSSAVPIEFFETSPSSPAKARTQQKSHRQRVTRKPVSAALPKKATLKNSAAKSPQNFKDTGAIALSNPKQVPFFDSPQPKTPAIAKKTTVAQKTLPPKSKSIYNRDLAAFQSTPESETPATLQSPKTPKTPKKKQVIKQARTIPVHKNPEPTSPPETPVDTEQQDLPLTQQQSSAPLNDIDPTPTADSSPNPSPSMDTQQELSTELPKQPGGAVKIGAETSLNKKGGGIAIATWEVEPGGLKKDLPDNPAQPKTPIREKIFNLPSINPGNDSQPKEIRAYLLINNDTGRVIRAMVYPDDLKLIPEAQKSEYQKYVEETFKDVEFTTASSNGQKSKSAELVVRIKIQRR
ncbi:hypothetical protein G7B40_014745 [Aetokthonos hydrillicola Thurmond2011]|jgi:hypothetical protein|uniref:Uncharacterized protein n=1 Tax=Aetokthonos hydrillicola Thurmond2011 TaxID=2712845 RepID=A0AAP5I9S0_9CYAN|nr:hypothetical protein [Aetokthonos hydrillicola]MBO3461393.1 hypothetical protein [Aetokthonos hydrillicola CCALA 1050]MBW4586829.1 hypothetical protein [Aetokthonos hydrillicola CCALA 1050]MDR9895813.1 hypothetical protein [Aetokthonos hydrillicola Thurmond2011]